MMLLLWTVSAGFARALPPLPLSAATGKQDVTPYLAYVRAEPGWRPADVLALAPERWKLAHGVPNLGFTSDAYWFRLDVRSADALDGLLAITYPVLDDVQVYALNRQQQLLSRQQFGDMQPETSQLLPNRYFLTPVRLVPGESRIFLIRVETDGSLQLPVSWFDRQHFYDREQRTLLVEGVYFGILMIMVIYNFFIFLILRDSSYSWYSLFVFAILVFQVSLEGFGFQFIWPSWPWVNSFIIPFSMSGCLFAGAVFSLRFLNVAKAHPRIDLTFRVTAAIGATIMAVSLLTTYALAVRLAVVACGVMAVYAIWAGFYLWLRGVSHARYYALGWSFLMPTIAILSLNKQGLLPVNFFTEYAIQLGSVIEATLFSFALGDRISLERKSKLAAQEQMLIQERALREELQRSHAQEMLAREKMVAAEAESRAKTRFLATMSHEIRTPLNGILGMVELLQGSELQAQQRTYTDVIAQSGQTLLSVINDILDYSKITAGKMQIETLDFDLQQLCMECESVFTFTAGKKHIELRVDRDQDVPVFIHSDPTRIRQILLNLLGNAFKFTDTGRVVLQVSMQKDRDQDFIRFTVTDTGIGIAPEQQDRLFESFAQADHSTTRRFGGTGLGLAISKRLSALLGGDIGLVSEPGKGAEFWFRIAYHPADPLLEAQPSQAAQDHGKFRLHGAADGFAGKTVLVADDNEVNLTVITAMLKKLGVKVVQTADGEKAAQYVYQHHAAIDLILMDCEMPLMDGFASTRHIRHFEAERRLKPLPIVALTAHVLPEYQQKCLEGGMDDYLAKPIRLRVLSSVLEQYWEKP
ncbi:MAG: 7TM diverse intracellular signaling domain-containing protein [Fluviicoccus sp.]|uniref:hybrid sensor histidine kinase/response regulator n=1 Tax=Fluviicoccus sp. TaxID=2003552 RepID=UPI0027191565|nr:hybrid sensor histidine kinase/response regulator [Fluviicoccus sp.]MDO8330254.1 7TM diverse intracellular signaling domain-containing protein [Fluviicoccus sp.]